MTTRLRRSPSAIAVLLLLFPLVQACGAPEAPRQPGATALVIGGRNNMPAPQLLDSVAERLNEAFLSQDTLFIVEVSGHPRVRYTERLTHSCSSEPACRGALNTFNRTLDGLIPAVDARQPEADTLGAILLAAQSVNGVDNDGPRQVIVIDSGLQTAGAMPLDPPGALFAEPPRIVEPWLEDGLLRDLAGVSVHLTFLGATYDPQPEVPFRLVAVLQELWIGVLTAGGANVTVDRAEPVRQPPADGLPPVTPVLFEDPPANSPVGCAQFREDEIGFVANKATFVDDGHAQDVLRPIATLIIDRQMSVTVIGTTALEEVSSPPLSLRRAQAVVAVLEQLGVPSHLMVAGGVGINFDGYVPPFLPDGTFSETMAKQNRLVFIEPVGRNCTDAATD